MARDVGLDSVERSGRAREAAMVSTKGYEGGELAQVHERQCSRSKPGSRQEAWR